jgi:lysyl-tRNA synthetase, class II
MSERDEPGRVMRDRIAKIEALRERGVEPYAYRFDPTHSTAEARAFFSGDAEETEPVRLAGRISSFRDMGKSRFAHLSDRDGRLQAYFRLNVLGEDGFALLDLLDPGDWVGVEGPVFRTRTGEITVRAERVELLAKSVRPLPFGKEEVDAETGERRVYSGFSDREARYRQRYADLAVNPEVRDVFVTRARVIRAIRTFLDERGFLEVETPVLQPLYGGSPTNCT